MRALIASWPRRFALAAAVFVLAMALGAAWLRHVYGDSDPVDNSLTTSKMMNTLLTFPALLAAFVLTVSSALALPIRAASSEAQASAASPPAAFKAQVIGVEWMNPLARRDYPTEWQLLWVQGLAQPNRNDDMVRTDPKSFTTIQPVAHIVSGLNGRADYELYFQGFMETLVRPFGHRYVTLGDYFYTIQPKDRSEWRELHGMHVQIAVPADPRLPAEQAADLVRKSMRREFEFYNPKLSTANIPADVQVTQGGANAGFTSLDAAMDYLEAHPDKSAWVINWDSPQFPNDMSMAENCTLLILAGPSMNTEREPLAWIARPARTHAKDFPAREGTSRRAQAWEEAVRRATQNAGVTPLGIGHVIHDLGVGPASAPRLPGPLQALAVLNPELHPLEDAFNTPKLLGEMGTGSALTNVALAIAWAHQKSAPVLVAGTTEPDDPLAVMVLPPARARVVDPEKTWFRARGEGNAYLPWWGLRRKANWATYMQGFSD